MAVHSLHPGRSGKTGQLSHGPGLTVAISPAVRGWVFLSRDDTHLPRGAEYRWAQEPVAAWPGPKAHGDLRRGAKRFYPNLPNAAHARNDTSKTWAAKEVAILTAQGPFTDILRAAGSS